MRGSSTADLFGLSTGGKRPETESDCESMDIPKAQKGDSFESISRRQEAVRKDRHVCHALGHIFSDEYANLQACAFGRAFTYMRVQNEQIHVELFAGKLGGTVEAG